MNTRKALKVMSGKAQADGPLAKYANKYKKAYEAKDAAIIARQNEPVIADPLIDVLRRKLAEASSKQDLSMPVVMRFDAYQVVRHAAESTKREDRGLKQLARHLEKLWTEEPMGSLSVGQLHELRAHYKDTYPKSKCAKVIDQDIPKVGYSTLPVAKLARIAATINDQADFDNAIQIHGLSGDQMHQVRARTLIRELVALKDANIDARTAADEEDLGNFENITNTLADEMDPVEEEIGMDMKAPVDGEMPLDVEAPPAEAGEMGGLVEGLEEVNQVGQEVLPKLPGAPEYGEAEEAEGGPSPLTDPLGWAASEGAETGPDGKPRHKFFPPSKGWQDEELKEHGKEDMTAEPLEEETFMLEDHESAPGHEMFGRRTAADLPSIGDLPPTGFVDEGDGDGEICEICGHVNPSDLMAYENDMSKNVCQKCGARLAQDPRSNIHTDVIARRAQMEQMSVKPHRLSDVPTEEDINALPGVGDAPVEELGLTPRDIRNGPSQGRDDVASAVEGYHGIRGMPADIGPGKNPAVGIDTDKHLRQQSRHNTPRNPFEIEDGEGIDFNIEAAEQSGEAAMSPPKPPKDGHTEVETYAGDVSSDGGAELKKGSGIGFTAAEIESALLDNGSIIKIGNVSISINDQSDEVELWVKDAGRACDLRYLDTAIADFMRYASAELHPTTARVGGYNLVKLVPVPCGKCASVSRFPPTKDPNDIYECDCGHRTRAATVLALLKHGTIQPEYKLDIQLPAKHTANLKQAKTAMSNTIKQLVTSVIPNARVEAFDGVGATIHIAGVSDDKIQKLQQKLRSSGIPKMSQVADPGAGAVGIPGGADTPIAPEPTQETVSPGAPPADKATDVRPELAPGTLTEDDIGAAFRHYKNMGKDGKPMLFLEAVGEFARDYKKQIENQWSEELDAVAIGIAEELFTSGKAPAAPANEPMAADPAAAAAEKVHEPMVEAPGGEQMPLAAARRVAFKILAQAKANMSPKVNQSQGDQVPGVGKKPLGPGKDSEQGTSFSDPAVKKKHTPKQKSPTGLGKATDGKDPGRFKAAPPNQHSNVPKKVTKDTNLGKDSDTFGKGIPVPKVTKNH